MPTSPTSWPACSATSARRSSRSGAASPTPASRFTVATGDAIAEADWDFFYRCYTLTYRAHHSTPYLTRDFFARSAATMARNWLLFTAWRGGKRIAASLIAIDPERKTAFGRYWGAVEHVNCLHFDACYYQPLEWCIANGYRRFEGGAQGEHKMARGLLPVQTWSAHWLAHPQFARAVDDFLAREGAGRRELPRRARRAAPVQGRAEAAAERRRVASGLALGLAA